MKYILTVIEVIILVWAVISWSEICCENLNENPQYSRVNLFRVVRVI